MRMKTLTSDLQNSLTPSSLGGGGGGEGWGLIQPPKGFLTITLHGLGNIDETSRLFLKFNGKFFEMQFTNI